MPANEQLPQDPDRTDFHPEVVELLDQIDKDLPLEQEINPVDSPEARMGKIILDAETAPARELRDELASAGDEQIKDLMKPRTNLHDDPEFQAARGRHYDPKMEGLPKAETLGIDSTVEQLMAKLSSDPDAPPQGERPYSAPDARMGSIVLSVVEDEQFNADVKNVHDRAKRGEQVLEPLSETSGANPVDAGPEEARPALRSDAKAAAEKVRQYLEQSTNEQIREILKPRIENQIENHKEEN